MLSSPKLLDQREDQTNMISQIIDGKIDNLDVILTNQEYRSEGEEKTLIQ